MIQLLIMIIIAFLLYMLQLKVYSEVWDAKLEVELSFQPTEMFEGDEGCLSEVIVNDKRLPLPLFNVKFQTDRNLLFHDSMETQKTDQYYRNDAFRIGGHEKLTRNLTFVANRRGCYQIEAVDLVASDLFLSTTIVTKHELEQKKFLYVYPKPFYSREFIRSLQMVNGLLQTKTQFLEDPFEYRGIREYQPYDDMKSINWKATAKTGDLKVNLRDFTAVKSIRIFLNLEDEGIVKRQDCAEVCIRMAAGIVKYFSERGMKVACFGNCQEAYSKKVLSLRSGSPLQDIYRSLAQIDLSKETVSFENYFANRMLTQTAGEYTFVISMNAYEDFVRILQGYHQICGDFMWFYPTNQRELPELPGELKDCFKPINIQHMGI